ncbi:FAD-dependent oxidoreductase [Planctomicrobium sp. SH664]|uniref:FAD-dependent oxidoreductase n=1 Tax=Planctomicrobium sp. SH664 TaxID=3448125 RepID=UPI003F5B62DF
MAGQTSLNRIVYDVVVIGAGGSGLAAAVSAAEAGLQVLVLEKNPQPGGTTAIAIGSFTAAGTGLQQRQGIADHVDWHQTDAGRFAPAPIEARNNEELRSWFLTQTAETYSWLESLGLVFQGPNPEPPNRVQRMHNVVPNAKAYIATLRARLQALGGEILCQTRVRSLQFDEGKVTGVVAETTDGERRWQARRGVVLATGDYASGQKLLSEFKGPEYAEIEGVNPTATGDGHELARQAGAQLLNMDVTYGPELRFEPPPRARLIQRLSSPRLNRLLGLLLPLVPQFLVRSVIKQLLVTWQHPEDSLFHDGAILVNRRGERFCNECAATERDLAIARQPEKRCYVLLDEQLIQLYSAWPKFISTAPRIAYAYVSDYLKLRPDISVTAKSLEALAPQAGLPKESLLRTVAQYNQTVEEQASDPWGRTRLPIKLLGEKWVLLGPARAYFTTTEGGAAISRRLEVLNESLQPIPGLYAVGQVGLGGQILWGHGLHIAWALTSGRLVGLTLSDQRSAATPSPNA